MELCDKNLGEVFDYNQKNSIVPKSAEVMDFVTQMSKATAFLYENNIMHRDIKPSHILIVGSPCCYKLTGFKHVRAHVSLLTPYLKPNYFLISLAFRQR